MDGGDEVGAVVVDVGSTTTKAGFAGEDSPKAVFPTSVGVLYSTGQDNVVGQGPKAVGDEGDTDAPSSSSSGSSNVSKRKVYYVGTSSLSVVKPDLEVVNPMEGGLVRDWEAIEQLWEHAFHKRLLMDPKEHPMLVAEASFNTRPLRERQTELLFEKYQIPALFVSKNAVLAAFASGKASALILDSGGGITASVPVHDGYALKKATMYSGLAGERLTQEYYKLLTERKGKNIVPYYQINKKEVTPGSGNFVAHPRKLTGITESYRMFHTINVVRDIKESICRVSEIPFDEGANATIPTIAYELPDCQVVEVGPDRFSIPELMFYPESLSASAPAGPENELVGVHKMVIDSIGKSDADLRKELWQNIIVTGGNTLIQGFNERLTVALQDSCPLPAGFKIRCMATPHTAERKFAVWIGGSILGSLGAFQQMWISKAEYEEHGRSCVERKCP